MWTDAVDAARVRWPNNGVDFEAGKQVGRPTGAYLQRRLEMSDACATVADSNRNGAIEKLIGRIGRRIGPSRVRSGCRVDMVVHAIGDVMRAVMRMAAVAGGVGIRTARIAGHAGNRPVGQGLG